MENPPSWSAVTVVPLDTNLSSDAFDGFCADLIELGALGTAVDRAPEVTCYLEGDQDKVDSFVRGLESLACKILSVSRIREENWTGACADVWEPIRAGTLEVVPVQSADDRRPASASAIRIIPGLGFGTGHHATTRMVLGALCEYASAVSQSRPQRVFDLGTGSGILAIAAAKLLGLPVDGNDIETGAIANARDNIALNNVTDLVTVSTAPLTQFSGPYDLLLANLYGEVLMNLAPEVTRITRPGSTAILSGITEIVWDQVWEVYGSQCGWELVSEKSDTGWMCAVIRRSTV